MSAGVNERDENYDLLACVDLSANVVISILVVKSPPPQGAMNKKYVVKILNRNTLPGFFLKGLDIFFIIQLPVSFFFWI